MAITFRHFVAMSERRFAANRILIRRSPARLPRIAIRGLRRICVESLYHLPMGSAKMLQGEYEHVT
jgi:hypothetical protein